MTEIQKQLWEMREDTYRRFMLGLLPSTDPDCVIGVRAPKIRALAGRMRAAEQTRFLCDLPHRWQEENMLHAFLLNRIRETKDCLASLDAFLPYVKNWAVCDSIRPACFAGSRDILLEAIPRWLADPHPYTVRFGMEMLMLHFLGDAFEERFPAMVAAAVTGDYYVKMVAAWYFATALVFRWDAILPYFEENRLPAWVHNKTIAKAVESRRISREQKEYLKNLRRTGEG